MSDNTVSIGGALKKAIPSLVLFAVGFAIPYQVLEDRNIAVCIIIGWFLGGTIYGWFLTGKWFPKRENSADENSMLHAFGLFFRLILSELVGIIAMPMEIGKLIIAIARAKHERDLAKAKRAENEQ